LFVSTSTGSFASDTDSPFTFAITLVGCCYRPVFLVVALVSFFIVGLANLFLLISVFGTVVYACFYFGISSTFFSSSTVLSTISSNSFYEAPSVSFGPTSSSTRCGMIFDGYFDWPLCLAVVFGSLFAVAFYVSFFAAVGFIRDGDGLCWL
jgi:hypothetical protein